MSIPPKQIGWSQESNLLHSVSKQLELLACIIAHSGIAAGGAVTIVDNYSALPPASTVPGRFYWVSNPQGTKWLPGALGGTFYDSGLYYSNGVTWELLEVPYQATQSDVNAGIINDQFVTPFTLNGATNVVHTENAETINGIKTFTSIPIAPGYKTPTGAGLNVLLDNGTTAVYGGGGGSNVYTGASPTTVTVGGLPSGTAIAGKTYTEILEAILVPYLIPSFSGFSISGQASLIEVGVVISTPKNFTWTFTNGANVAATTMSIIDVTAGNIDLATGLSITPPASINIGTIINTSPMSQTWKGKATNSKAATFETGTTGNAANFTISSIYPVFYYKSSSPITFAIMQTAIANGTATKLTSSGNVVTSVGTITIPYNLSSQYMAFAYPDSTAAKTTYFVTSLDTGPIGGVFPGLTTLPVTSPTGLWTNINYRIHTSNLLNNSAANIQFS